ncbi:MFS transporter [Cohnella sp. JJ-181]|uniref:MFS transporter n=1 Tax=Cohnella rhizoplanae TaxID=2974897 RepID=UPI0022FFB291|nr:MFS transporter [Cohnella sp. JJ-181]CAI6086926.1 Multidrug resistance protein Stp [Cohnella sp. JJ-181]
MSTLQRNRMLVIICLALFMVMLDTLVLGVALPSIQKSFDAGIADLEWFTNGYTLTFAVLLIPLGMLGERYGRKRVFLIGIAVFTLGSLASALSTDALGLTLARALQGVGGAAIAPISLTLVSAAFPPKFRAAAIGIVSGVSGLGLATGPLVGGLIVNGSPWQTIFWINVPIGALAVACGWLWLRESKGEEKRLDIVGLLLIAAALLGIVFGLVRGNEAGWGAFEVWGSLAGGVALLPAFIAWEWRHPFPLLSLRLFKNRDYGALIVTGFWLYAGIFGAIFLLTLFLQQAQGYSALGAGVREMAWTGATMIAAPLAGLLIGRLGTRRVLLAGLLLQTVALCLFAILILANGAVFSFAYLAPAMVLAGLGMGLSLTPLSEGVLSAVPESSSGEASGVSNATRELGGVFGIAIGSLVFRQGGPIATPDDFGAHLTPVLYVYAAMLGAAFVATLLFYKRSGRAARESGKAVTAAAAME